MTDVKNEKIVNGKVNEETTKAFRKVGLNLSKNKKPAKKDWETLTEGLKNYYRRHYDSLTKTLI